MGIPLRICREEIIYYIRLVGTSKVSYMMCNSHASKPPLEHMMPCWNQWNFNRIFLFKRKNNDALFMIGVNFAHLINPKKQCYSILAYKLLILLITGSYMAFDHQISNIYYTILPWSLPSREKLRFSLNILHVSSCTLNVLLLYH